MPENAEHIMLKQLVADYMKARDWYVETEFRIEVNGDFRQNNGRAPTKHITVDVFAVKNGKEYVAEIGRIAQEERMELLSYVFDTADHLQLDFGNARKPKPNFDEIESVEYNYEKDGEEVNKKTAVYRGNRRFI